MASERPEELKEALKLALGSGKPEVVEVYIENVI